MATLKIGDKVLNLDDAEDLMNDDAIAVEKAYGKTFDQWLRDMNAGSITAITVFVWILRRLNGEPGLRLGDVHFKIRDLIDEDAEKDDADKPVGDPPEVVPGGSTAEFDPANPTPAPEVSTDGASDTSPSSPTSTELLPATTDD